MMPTHTTARRARSHCMAHPPAELPSGPGAPVSGARGRPSIGWGGADRRTPARRRGPLRARNPDLHLPGRDARGVEGLRHPMADQYPALLKRLLLLLWALWLTVVLASNVADGCKALGLLGEGWAFASG